MAFGYEVTYVTLGYSWNIQRPTVRARFWPGIGKWNCVDKRNIYRLLRDFYDLQCGNLGQAICNRPDILWLMFITMPASKYTLFVPAEEQ